MYRRKIIRFGILAGTWIVAGCGGRTPDEVQPRLKVSVRELERVNSDWRLRVRVANALHQEVGANDVSVVAFSDTGDEVCRTDIGDLDRHDQDRRVTVRCEEFPAIITVISEESPCDGARPQVIYWIGTEEQRRDPPSDSIVWESYYRECNESIPTERALENVHKNEED